MTTERWRRLGLALGLGILGGAAFWWLGWPLPWMLGSMLATLLASLARLPVAVPSALRAPMMAILGVLLGSGFTPELVGSIVTWLPTIFSLPFYVVLVTAASTLYLRRVLRFDPKTALFAGTPGGFGEMVLFGDRVGADIRRIALVHSARILLIVLLVPIAVRAAGFELPATARAEAADEWLDLFILGCAALTGFWLGPRLHLPAPALLGGMLASALVHLLGWVEGAPPPVFIGLAQLVIGCSVGCRFVGFPVRDIVATLLGGLGLTLVMFGVAFLAALAVHRLTGFELLLLLLAFVPGGVAEMSVIALALGADPAFVAAHHIVRIAITVAAAPFAVRWLERRTNENAGPGAGVP